MSSHIRLARESDAAAIAAIYRPTVESSVISFEAVAPDAVEIARRVHETLPDYPWLVCERDGQVAGYAYASRHSARAAYRWSVNTSVYVDAAHWRRGVGRGLYQSLFAILVSQGYVNAYAGITLPNPSSVGLHESVGFTPVGVYREVGYKLGRWHDVGWWERALAPRADAPGEPQSLAAAQARPDWGALVDAGEPRIR